MNQLVDEYIAKKPAFAQPLLNHFRSLVHKVCPEIEEKIKWGFPSFEYKGLLCSMAAFKNHCTFGFWKGALLKDEARLMSRVGETHMGHFDHIRQLSDLPSDETIIAYIQEAVLLNEQSIKIPKITEAEKKELVVPEYFLKRLSEHPKAENTFNQFSYTNKKDYVEWITDAKTETTLNKRLKTAIEWLNEGKVRNWKYIK